MADAHKEVQVPEFQARRLRDIEIPAVDMLRDDDFGAAVLAEFHDRAQKDFHSNPCLRVLKTTKGTVHGSNPFTAVLIDMIVRPRYRIATPADLQAAFDARSKCSQPPELRGCYKDTALVLRSAGEPNGYLASKLNEQVGLKVKLPLVICLTGLDLVNDSESRCGLAFKITEDSYYFSAPILMEKSGHFDNRTVDRETGLPIRLGGSQRYFYSAQEGLTRLYVGRGWSLDSIWDELGNSQPDGRTVLATSGVEPQKLSKYLAYLDAANRFLHGREQ